MTMKPIMIDCPKCKTSIENDSWFCDQCGLELKICTHCGSYGKGNRCTQCGSVLITAKEEAQQVFTPQFPNIQNVNITSPQTANTNQIQGIPSIQQVAQPSVLFAPPVLFCASLQIRIEAVDKEIIGRKKGSYIHIFETHAYVSGTHARFDLTPTGWTITDLDSTNGTFYNNTQLLPNVPCKILIGGKIKIADIEFVIER